MDNVIRLFIYFVKTKRRKQPGSHFEKDNECYRVKNIKILLKKHDFRKI